ncbi:hypothetical protein ACLB2K_049942 [Fragaria x ananassa]
MSAPKLLLGPPKPSNTTTNTATKPPMGRTENSSAAYLSSGNPCLDLFFHIVPDTPSSYINEQLPKSWAHNALISSSATSVESAAPESPTKKPSSRQPFGSTTTATQKP